MRELKSLRKSEARKRQWDLVDPEKRREIMSRANAGTTIAATLRRIERNRLQMVEDLARITEFRVTHPDLVFQHEVRMGLVSPPPPEEQRAPGPLR